MFNGINNFIRNERMHFRLFDLGIFFLASAPTISIFFLLISSFTGSLKRKDNFFKDKINYPFFMASLLILISSIWLFIFGEPKLQLSKESLLLGSINWIPFFYVFWAFKKFLATDSLRRRCANLLICGTLPVLLSGILQKIFKIYGPFSILDKFIIWYQKDEYNLTAVFNNPNYAATWLCLILPFCFAKLLSNKVSNIKKISYLILTITTIACIIYTNSRNGFLSIILSSVIMLDAFSKIYLLVPFIIILFLLSIGSFLFASNMEIFPYGEIFKKLKFPDLTNFNELPRVKIMKSALYYIFKRPLLGWGAATFPVVYKFLENPNEDLIFFNTQHTHNIFLEVAYIYGIPVSLLIFIPISLIIYKSSININSKNLYYEKAWKLSAIIFIVMSQFDFTYYDVRLSTLFWILITGLSCCRSRDNKLINSN